MPEIKEFLHPGRRAHLIGIGGVSMCALAEVLRTRGLVVSGSDSSEGAPVMRLRSLGIPVSLGHTCDFLEGADMVIRTAAVHDDNPEVIAARERDIPVFERAQAWGKIMEGFENSVCISGTHGKTTTTSMTTQIALDAGIDPTVMIGGFLPSIGASHRLGANNTIIMEACEYANSFLSFRPTIAVLLNIDIDHLDFFRDLDDIAASFRRFAGLVPDSGYVIANNDDDVVRSMLKPLNCSVITFGMDRKADVYPANLSETSGRHSFDICRRGETLAGVSLRLPGRHNVQNALAAACAALCLGISPDVIGRSLSGFSGVGRRFELKGSYNGAQIFDDYAHHPSEVRALLSSVSGMGKRVVCVFQPHTYSRTIKLFDDFCRELSNCGELIICEVYAAREQNETGFSAESLADAIEGARFMPDHDSVVRHLAETVGEGDLVLTVGAGDVYKIGEALASRKQPVLRT